MSGSGDGSPGGLPNRSLSILNSIAVLGPGAYVAFSSILSFMIFPTRLVKTVTRVLPAVHGHLAFRGCVLWVFSTLICEAPLSRLVRSAVDMPVTAFTRCCTETRVVNHWNSAWCLTNRATVTEALTCSHRIPSMLRQARCGVTVPGDPEYTPRPRSWPGPLLPSGSQNPQHLRCYLAGSSVEG